MSGTALGAARKAWSQLSLKLFSVLAPQSVILGPAALAAPGAESQTFGKTISV